MKKLSLKENSNVFGSASQRRCDRLLRRSGRALRQDRLDAAERILDTHDRIC